MRMCLHMGNRIVKGAHGVVKVLQAAHSSYWGIWGHAPPGRRLLLRPFCAKNANISYVLASRISMVATHPPVR